METLNQIVLSSIKIGVCIAKCYCKEQHSIRACAFCKVHKVDCDYYREATQQEQEFYVIDKRLARIEEALNLPLC